MHTGIGSFNREHLVKHNIPSDKIEYRMVNCMKLSDLLDKYKIKELDYLFIDAEGSDADILLSLDFSRYKVKNIVFEYWHIDHPQIWNGKKTEKLIRHLKDHGYHMYEAESNGNIEAITKDSDHYSFYEQNSVRVA